MKAVKEGLIKGAVIPEARMERERDERIKKMLGGSYIQPINHKPSEKYCCGAGTPPNILYKPF